VTPEMQNQLKSVLGMKDILNFDKSASIYKEEEKLGPGQGGGMRWMSSMTGGGGTYIKM
jgi:hypothetical protein